MLMKLLRTKLLSGMTMIAGVSQNTGFNQFDCKVLNFPMRRLYFLKFLSCYNITEILSFADNDIGPF